MVKIKNISFSFKEFDSIEELDQNDRELVIAARRTALNAYAPYSKFKVGATIRLESGQMIMGTNVENAAYPSGICAEQNALSNAISNHNNDNPVSIAIAALTENGQIDDPVSPCGNCRQVIAEEELRIGKKIKIILSGKDKIITIDSIESLLPMQFNKRTLDVIPH
jgi:cytidine deaminase